jgi:hypothetical protein
VRSDETDVNDPIRIVDPHHNPILVAGVALRAVSPAHRVRVDELDGIVLDAHETALRFARSS